MPLSSPLPTAEAQADDTGEHRPPPSPARAAAGKGGPVTTGKNSAERLCACSSGPAAVSLRSEVLSSRLRVLHTIHEYGHADSYGHQFANFFALNNPPCSKI